MDVLPTGGVENFIGHIFHADALDLLRALPSKSIDMILTDPPFGLNKKPFALKSEDRNDFGSSYAAIRQEWDNEIPLAWMYEVDRIIKKTGSVLIFGGRKSIYHTASEGLKLNWRIVNDITLVKPDAPPNFTGRMMTESTERAIWFSPNGSHWTYNRDVAKTLNNGVNFRDVWEMMTPKSNRLHPAQKSLDTIALLIMLLSCENDIVVDPFCGSGTTAIAARNLGRQFIAGDITQEYIEMARTRLANTDPYSDTTFKDGSKQLSLFRDTEK